MFLYKYHWLLELFDGNFRFDPELDELFKTGWEPIREFNIIEKENKHAVVLLRKEFPDEYIIKINDSLNIKK
jgi:hypothetical protein